MILCSAHFLRNDDFVSMFFSGEKLFRRKKILFRGLIFFQVHSISFVKKKANFNFEQQKCNRVLVSKVKFYFQIFQGINILPTNPVFSNWVEFIKKSVNHKLF